MVILILFRDKISKLEQAATADQTAAVLNGPQFLAASTLKNPIGVENTIAQVPQGPGLGVEVDQKKLTELAAKTTRDWYLTEPIAAI